MAGSSFVIWCVWDMYVGVKPQFNNSMQGLRAAGGESGCVQATAVRGAHTSSVIEPGANGQF